MLIIKQLNELKEEYENEELLKSSSNNNPINSKRKFINNLSIEENMKIILISSKNKNENISIEEKNILITHSRKSETNSSTNKNKNEIMKNINTNKL